MPFTPPTWVPKLPFEIPDTLSVEDFIFDEKYRSRPLLESKAPFVCGLSGRSYTVQEVRQRVDHLARELSCRLQWHPSTGSPSDKIVAIYSLDSVSRIAAGLHTELKKEPLQHCKRSGTNFFQYLD
jgi:hypothetical protein